MTHARFPTGEARAERAARAAAETGYRVDVIALRGDAERACEQLEGITVWRMPLRHRRGAPLFLMALEYCLFTVLAALWTLGLRVRAEIDIVEVHSPPEFLVLAGLLPKLFGAVLLLDVRDLSSHLWDARFGASRRSMLMIGLLKRLERAACALADAVLTVHDPYRAQLIARGADERKIEVVMNSPEGSMVARAQRAPVSRPDGRFTVVYHGTITRWYGVDLLIEAIGLLCAGGRPVRAVVLGEGDQLEPVRKLAASLEVSDSVSFSNRYLPIDEALRIVASADCGVIPNRPCEINRFILPNKLFEYVALGIPVVSARLETIAAHFNDDEITFCQAGDPASLARAIEWIMDEGAAAEQKSARAQEHARMYRWEVNRARYLDLLLDLQDGRFADGVRQ